jgi:hypothetical protein
MLQRLPSLCGFQRAINSDRVSKVRYSLSHNFGNRFRRSVISYGQSRCSALLNGKLCPVHSVRHAEWFMRVRPEPRISNSCGDIGYGQSIRPKSAANLHELGKQAVSKALSDMIAAHLSELNKEIRYLGWRRESSQSNETGSAGCSPNPSAPGCQIRISTRCTGTGGARHTPLPASALHRALAHIMRECLPCQ